MHQLIKAMTVVGMVATGLPLLTEAANAQAVAQWNLVRPFSCYTWQNFNPDGSPSTNYMTVTDSTNWYSFLVSDPAVISALFKFCDDGKPFYAWGRPQGLPWNTVYVYPGLN
jgi:hypothetical protein